VLTLESGSARLVVAPERGGRIMALSVDGLDLLVTPDVDDHNFGCFPMAPWTGRIGHGRFDFDGQRYQLPLNNPPHSIHGTAREQWPGAATVTLETSCPCVVVAGRERVGGD
jgi:aldose 1-epimerase